MTSSPESEVSSTAPSDLKQALKQAYDEVTLARQARRSARIKLQELIEHAYGQGYTWEAIGQIFGISRQSAHQLGQQVK